MTLCHAALESKCRQEKEVVMVFQSAKSVAKLHVLGCYQQRKTEDGNSIGVAAKQSLGNRLHTKFR